MDTVDGTTKQVKRRGGARPGAGRKRKPPFLLLDQPALQSPENLPATAAAVWRQWSMLAQRQGSLTGETAPALAVICIAAAELTAALKQRHEAASVAQLCRLVFDGLSAFGLAPQPHPDSESSHV